MAAGKRLICASDALSDAGDGVRFELAWNGETAKAFVIRHNGRLHAYLNQCGHIPVELDWQEGQFLDHSGLYLICSTHGALYSPETGHCISGRCAGKGLTPLPVTEENGHVYLIEDY
jgi:nitrite reductase/ring-hydroxylating ferredoxin subunit